MGTNFEDRGGRQRRKHSDEFKAQIVAACSVPGVSNAAVAMSHGVNPNLARRWVRLAERRGGSSQPKTSTKPSTFVPVQLASPVPIGFPEEFPKKASPRSVLAAPADIRVELRRGALAVSISWPSGDAAQCAAWLTELLR